MLIFCHVCAGMLLGIPFSRGLRSRMAIGLAVLGSVLPDLLDKPLALFVFPGPTTLGQTFGHVLIAFLLFVAASVAVFRGIFRKYPWYLGLLLPAAVLIHQLMDMAWQDPVTWLYPVLGPLQPCDCGGAGYVGIMSVNEVVSVSEWIFLAVILLLAALLFRPEVARWTGHDPEPAARRLYPGAIILLLLLAGAAITAGSLGLRIPLLAGGDDPSGYFMLAAVAAIGAGVLAWQRADIFGRGEETGTGTAR